MCNSKNDENESFENKNFAYVKFRNSLAEQD